eukprot:TRINITY_DN12443_c0_g1_i1.p1 TRINITY_DN12443_c0_g1~~TRINITY_DN12443_c0_g1_i1.p1  ORF type:complete len:207 (+),score=18.96 TRINITY_DN12443_c0_g1_i1:159-779(+)
MHKVDSILDAAQRLFAQKGFEATPVSEIAALAEVSPGTVIYYFKSKDNLLFIVTWRVMHNLYKKTVAAVAMEKAPLPRILQCLHTFFSFLRNNTAGQSFLLKNTAFDTLNVDVFPEADLKILHERYVRTIELQIQHGMEQGSIRNDVDPRSTAYGIYALMIGAGRLYIYHGESLDMLEKEARIFVLGRLTGEPCAGPLIHRSPPAP